MRITADTNILVRIIVRDDVAQAEAALDLLEKAEMVFIPLPCLCEFAWILDATYRLPREMIARSLRGIAGRANVAVERTEVTAGLRVLDAGGDFADGAIAAAGALMGAGTFVSFDRKAVAHIKAAGMSAELARAST